MNRQHEYRVDHWAAKLIVAIVVCSLLMAGRYSGYIAFDMIAVFVWLFAVNGVAHVIECIAHHKHKHPWI